MLKTKADQVPIYTSSLEFCTTQQYMTHFFVRSGYFAAAPFNMRRAVISRAQALHLEMKGVLAASTLANNKWQTRQLLFLLLSEGSIKGEDSGRHGRRIGEVESWGLMCPGPGTPATSRRLAFKIVCYASIIPPSWDKA